MMGKLNACIFWLKMTSYYKKHNSLWDKVSANIKKKFDSEPVYNKNYGNETTDFLGEKIPKLGSNLV